MDFKNLQEKLTTLNDIIDKHKGSPGSLIGVLQETQSLLGNLPGKVLDYIAARMEIPPADVHTLASVYPGLNNEENGEETPARHRLCVCKGTSCYIRGANTVLDRVSKELNVEPGCITTDRKFSVDVVRCVGACALGPVITVDEAVYPRTTPEKVSDILDKYNK